ncbi:MAG: phage major capsid protein, P2 family [Acinetobacter baumannii]|nr:phage major capsid protein, P2 family [Acinetobacter baumannii]
MQKLTREKFSYTVGKIAEANNVADPSKKFTVEPSVAQKMKNAIQQSVAFLKQINVVLVPEMKGEAIGLTQGQTIASRTNTKTGTIRKAVDPTGLESNPYECVQTNFDVALRYEKLDAWAQFPEFYAKWQAFVNRVIALDMIMIGWNGTSVAVTTDRTAYPLLQDVNIGWLEKIRTKAPEHHMKQTEGGVKANAVVIGATGDFKNLDALVVDVVSNLIDEVHQDDTDLVVICGRQLLSDKNFPLVNDSKDNADTLAGQVLLSQKQIGGLPAARVPFFPDNALLVTSLDNLSIYQQESAKRRSVEDNASLDQVEDRQSSNDAYVVETYGKVAFVENIEIQ